MEIGGIGGQNTQEVQNKPNGELNVEDFLQIMTAQLQHMDPMGENSVKSSEYINQMATFTMMEQMTELASNLENLTILSQQQLSFGLVGKEATVQNAEGEQITGTVERVRYEKGQAYPIIDGVEYSMGAILEVGEEKA